MNEPAARTSDFGTGLRAHIERGHGLAGRLAVPSSRDLVLLCMDEPVERPSRELTLVSPEQAVRGPSGAFAA